MPVRKSTAEIFGFDPPPGTTQRTIGIGDRHACDKCGYWLPDHEFNETCDWQCQGCGKLTPPSQERLLRNEFITVCDACYAAAEQKALVKAGLLQEPPHAE